MTPVTVRVRIASNRFGRCPAREQGITGEAEVMDTILLIADRMSRVNRSVDAIVSTVAMRILPKTEAAACGGQICWCVCDDSSFAWACFFAGKGGPQEYCFHVAWGANCNDGEALGACADWEGCCP